ncbi:ParB/RepB/Spo0J family partition protein [Salmonella enterica]|nr:ParB/RepB/Spo0J family partition protein [Salmonella enterica]
MPVTKCEPETTRKASRKSVKTQETVLSALLAQTEEVSVPLASLIKSPLNVRTVPYSAESVSELAESIKGVGLLQNLVVHTLPGDRYGVAAGGRRLAALNMLAERGIIPADWPVRVKVIPQELATAASMTENGHRRDMHPAEQIAGFRAMAQEGKTPAQIGDLLGYSPRHVQRMLKLADLAPVILDALAEDRITTEHCQALALENDTARQVQVFEAACQSGWGGKPEVQTIRRLVTESEVAVAGNSKFRFVGADAFSPDELRTDLFSDDGDAVQAALMQQPDKSLALLAWTLCLNVFDSGAYSKPAQISLECKHYSLTSDAPSGKEGAAFLSMMAEKARLAALLPEGWSRDMTTFLSLSQEVLLSLLSFCTACSLNGVQTRECGRTSRSPLDSLESAIGFHMRDWWQPTKANFFGHLKKPQIIAALNDAGLSGAARDAEKMKKGDAAEHAEFHMKDNRWVPGWMCSPRPQTDATERADNLADAA